MTDNRTFVAKIRLNSADYLKIEQHILFEAFENIEDYYVLV